eukprot:scaffold54614_cov39-Phaeocystis_antarctica.AAC.2
MFFAKQNLSLIATDHTETVPSLCPQGWQTTNDQRPTAKNIGAALARRRLAAAHRHAPPPARAPVARGRANAAARPSACFAPSAAPLPPA